MPPSPSKFAIEQADVELFRVVLPDLRGDLTVSRPFLDDFDSTNLFRGFIGRRRKNFLRIERVRDAELVLAIGLTLANA